MFGLTKREQRWNAEQQLADSIFRFAGAAVQAAAISDIRENERQAMTIKALTTERDTLADRVKALEADLVEARSKRDPLAEFNEELFNNIAFNSIAYSYRSWPRGDLPGVAKRYEELVTHVKELIASAHKLREQS